MIFNEAVQKAVENTPGALAALLMGLDGITLSNYVKPGADIEMEVVGVEYATLLTEVRKACDILEAGEARELTITSDKYVVIMRSVSKEYFMALALTPEGNVGKGRFILRVQVPKVQKEL